MSVLACFLLWLLGAQSVRAEISLQDYIYWTKADISAWHQYFPSRYLKQEHLTIKKAIDTVEILQKDIRISLAATVRYQQQELETARFSFEGTYAQECVSGIASFMDRAIDDAVDSFEECVADVVPWLRRIDTAWAKTNSTYSGAYQRALDGVDYCARNYPNRDARSRLKTCVESCVSNYFAVANGTTADLYYSKAMDKILYTVAFCGQYWSGDIVTKGRQFLGKLVTCANLSENINAEMYEKEMTSEFENYVATNDLYSQIWAASFALSRSLIGDIEKQMIHYYNIQKTALEKYVLESRDQSFYYRQVVQYLRKYSNTVSSTSVDNPASSDCVSAAYTALNNIFNTGAAKALECDSKIVNNTKFLIGRVNDYFSLINDILPYTGNVAILSCLSKGYIFAEQTILDCYTLELNSFKINITELNATIVDDVRVLQEYEKSFFSSSSLPCGEPILSRAVLEADRALYNLQRCLYISTGSKYAVTTVAPYTTTTTVAPYTSTSPYPTDSTTSPMTTTSTTSTSSPPSRGASRG